MDWAVGLRSDIEKIVEKYRSEEPDQLRTAVSDVFSIVEDTAKRRLRDAGIDVPPRTALGSLVSQYQHHLELDDMTALHLIYIYIPIRNGVVHKRMVPPKEFVRAILRFAIRYLDSAGVHVSSLEARLLDDAQSADPRHTQNSNNISTVPESCTAYELAVELNISVAEVRHSLVEMEHVIYSSSREVPRKVADKVRRVVALQKRVAVHDLAKQMKLSEEKIIAGLNRMGIQLGAPVDTVLWETALRLKSELSSLRHRY